MRKRILLALILALPVAGLSVLLASDRLLFGTVKALIASTSDLRLELTEPSLSWTPFRFSAALLLVTPEAQNSAPIFALQGLDVRGSVSDWLAGRSTGTMRASNLSVYIDETAPGGPPDASTLLEPLVLFPSRIDIESIHLISRGDNVWIFPLVNLSAQRQENGAIAAIAAAKPATTPLVIEALLTPESRFGIVQGVGVRSQIVGRDGEIALSVDGHVTADATNLAYDFAITGNYSRIGDFLMALDENAIALQGELSLNGRIKGNLDELALQIDELEVDNGEAYRFTARGSLEQVGDMSPVLSMTLEGVLNDAQALPMLPEGFRTRLGASTLTLQVAGTLAVPVVESLQLSTSTPGGIELEAIASGLRADTAELMQTINDTPIRVRLSAPDQLGLSALLERPLPPFGPWSVTGIITVEGDDYSVEAIDASLSLGDDTRMTVTGLIGRISVPPASSGKTSAKSMTDITLAASLTGDPNHTWWNTQAALSNVPVSAQRLDLRLSGAVADLDAIRGIDILLDIPQIELAAANSTVPVWLPFPLKGSGSARVSGSADNLTVQDMQWQGVLADASTLTLNGDGALRGGVPEADFSVTLRSAQGANLPQPGPFLMLTNAATAQVRLRDRYATVLAAISTPHAPLQVVVSADLENGGVNQLSADLYTASLDLADLSVPGDSDEQNKATEPTDWSEFTAPFPIHATLRIDDLRGDFTSIDNVAVDIEADGGSVILRQFDMRYATGSLELRGVLDVSGKTPAMSIAGLGTHVPLAALGKDLELQQEISGELSIRGGVSATGGNSKELMETIAGRIAVALEDTTISGAAYDLLMSNILAWLVSGANEDTTTFDCSMAQFDFQKGVASTDSIYIETPRMVATGKARVDLVDNSLDLRLEPRSRTRSLQFPSAIRMTGQLSDPKVSVSALQATADASAQVLLLLPSLTLKLFGIGNDRDGPARPCEAALQ